MTTVCRHGHQHDGWEARVRCDFDTVSPRDADGQLIESAPMAEQPVQAALSFEEGKCSNGS